ncbi:TerD family protein [Streptomyces sp. NPDC002104]
MPNIRRGANAPLTTGPFRITVARTARPGTPAVAGAAILLDAVGRVRDDADVLLAAGPRHPSGAVRHLGGAEEGGLLVQRLEVDPDDVEPSVQRILIAALTAGGTFGAVDGLSVEVAAGDGTPMARYEVTDAAMDTALVLGECYRRNGAWRFRAVGQGYTGGPDALAADYGIRPQALPAAPAPPVDGPVPTEVDKVSAAGAAPGSGPATAPGTAGPSAGTAGPVAEVPPPAPAASPPAPAASPAAPAAFPALVEHAPVEHGPPGGWSEADGLHEGYGEQVLTLVHPDPGGPALLEYETLGPTDSHTWFTCLRIDDPDDPVQLFYRASNGLRGQQLAFGRGSRIIRLRVEANCRWRLRLRPAGTARALRSGASGQGSAVLSYAGPPALLGVRRGRGGDDAWLKVMTVREDGLGHLVAQPNHRHPVTGPLAVGPGGVCHVQLEAPEAIAWELDVRPLNTAPVLDRKLSGRGPEVVLVPGRGARAEVRHDGMVTPLFALDEHLFPGDRLCTGPGVHDLPPGPVSVRASGKWSLRVRD